MMMEGAVRHWASSATRWQDKTVIELLEKISRLRDLQPEEQILMQRTSSRLKPKRPVWRWKITEDRQILDLVLRRKRLGRPKPFQRNDELRLLAEKLGRTEWAVRRRMERLLKCSDASDKQKG
jgi:hypothetical protein